MGREDIAELLSLYFSELHPAEDNRIIKRRKSMNYNKEACAEFLEYAATEIGKAAFQGLNPLLANVLTKAFTNAARVMRERGCSTDDADRDAVLSEIGKELGITNGKVLIEDGVIGQEFQALMTSGVHWSSETNGFVYPDELEIRKKLAKKYGTKLDTLTKRVRKCEKKWKAEQDKRSISIGIDLIEDFFSSLKAQGIDSISHEDLHRILSSMLERNFSKYEEARDWCRRLPDDEADLVLRTACNKKVINKSVDGYYTFNSTT
ncbi:hypothetical protein [Vibrio cholerae]|uniref:hypothetical protein n=1 Tax=Vibrio cholerae TaxID=666 RepID=UPI0028DACF1E|nr:hypothetical protein [Vibrio cholerae]ELJ8720574.1 hypothetical protein [Vibrio cholerae]MDV2354583.1 hypothetical protein [Vibrio cholerae]